MKSVIDIISDVVTAMRPSETVTVISGSSPYNVTGIERSDLMYVGQKLKFVGNSPNMTSYVTVATVISQTEITVTSSDALTKGRANNTGTLQAVINFQYGHPIEVVNRLSEMTKHSTYKREMFPAVCLMLDVQEKVDNNAFQGIVTIRDMFLITDTRPEFTAAERKTNNFDTRLNGLYELFIGRLQESTDIVSEYPPHDRWERYNWGKEGLYGGAPNPFNDFIDAIQIANLELKILKNCE